MQVRRITNTTSIRAPRGGVVVCVSIEGPSEPFGACLRSVLAHTPSDVPILVCDDTDTDLGDLEAIAERVEESDHERELLHLAGHDGVPYVFAITAQADVVVLRADSAVAAGWLEGLRQAAYADSRVATASALASGSLPSGRSFDDAAAAVRSRSLRLRPRLVSDAGPCRYVRRSAIELVGDGASAFAPTGSGEADFARRCTHGGLSHVLADDVLVRHNSPGGYDPWSHRPDDRAGALARSLHCARRALTGLSVVVDARILSHPMTGTQLHVVEVIAALARTQKVRLSAIIPDSIGEEAARSLASLPGLTLVTDAGARGGPRTRADVLHRPFQIDNPGELNFLTQLADRLVITHQDLIGYHNPSYFGSREAWNGYRELTRNAFAIADRVLFFSGHARDEALEEELVEADRASVVNIGVDHRTTRTAQQPVRPQGAARLSEDAEVLLCLGNDYRHKNRLFALRMLEELRRRHDWRGCLVLAGPRVAAGSSAQEEQRMLNDRPQLRNAVLDLGPVREAEKDWLLRRARLVVYPTVHEGFGLVPFEAADRGIPCMWAAGTSLSELLPDSAASIIAWNAQQSADRALELLRDQRERKHNIEAIRGAGSQLTWDGTAAHLIALYEATCDAPATPAGALHRRRQLANGAISEDAARLVGPGGALPTYVERPLLALATHPRIGTPVFRALKLGYRASYTLRRRGRTGYGS